MKANELRIGNWVFATTGSAKMPTRPYQVDAKDIELQQLYDQKGIKYQSGVPSQPNGWSGLGLNKMLIGIGTNVIHGQNLSMKMAFLVLTTITRALFLKDSAWMSHL